MPNQTNQDQADGKFDKNVPSQGSEDTEQAGEVYSQNLMGESNAEKQVRENEDASLQDDSYAFDSDNTGIDEYHDADDASGEEGESEIDDYLH
jgi:hypothetical protein